MRFSKHYVMLAILLVVSLFWKLNNWNDRYAQVETFRGAALEEDVFYPLMSKNLNDTNALSVYINGEEYSITNSSVILDDTLSPAVSFSFINSVLRGSVFMASADTAIVQITNDVYGFTIGEDTAVDINSDLIQLASTPSLHNGEMYIGLADLCRFFGYEYSYDDSSYVVNIEYEKTAALPSKYDLRDINRVSVIRNQGTTATCWACASLEALESSLLPSENYLFSVDSMIYDNSFGLDESDGGDYTMALAYLLSWQGPVFSTAEEDAILSTTDIYNTSDTSVHLQEVHFYDSEDLDEIKWAVYQYGGVSTSIYASVSTSNLVGSSSYNKLTNSYCYRGSAKPNHDVVIVGWDDNYSADNFSSDVPGDGAFICQNSWGSGFGDSGIFYISYYDTNIGNQAVSYVLADTNNTYNYIYQSDLCGWVGQVGYSKEWAYGANTYVAEADQQIEAAGFYALGEDTTYQLYFVSNYENTSTLATKELVASGTLEEAGYYTIEFDSARTVSEGESFAIVLYVNTPDTLRPMAVEYAADDMTAAVTLEDGMGFISNNGLDWENVEDVANANLCIKAYANDVAEVFEE